MRGAVSMALAYNQVRYWISSIPNLSIDVLTCSWSTSRPSSVFLIAFCCWFSANGWLRAVYEGGLYTAKGKCNHDYEHHNRCPFQYNSKLQFEHFACSLLILAHFSRSLHCNAYEGRFDSISMSVRVHYYLCRCLGCWQSHLYYFCSLNQSILRVPALYLIWGARNHIRCHFLTANLFLTLM